MEFRNYQKEIINKGTQMLHDKGLLYLAMEVRTGKTFTALGICERVGASSILFITKKKAISSIQADYDAYAPSYTMEVINYESLHKIDSDLSFDIIICDEAHSMGAFAPPNKRAKQVKELISKHGCSLILLSGTPTPESFSQIYHQMYGHPNNPFSQYKNFYRWADDYVIVKQKMIGGNRINDYSNGRAQKILEAVAPYTINYTQKEAGFKSEVEEEILHVKMSHLTYMMSSMLRNDRVITGNDEVILADTGAKLMSKLHQLYSGTAIFESGNAKTIDYSKAHFIAKRSNIL